jgi:hypothetical protein
MYKQKLKNVFECILLICVAIVVCKDTMQGSDSEENQVALTWIWATDVSITGLLLYHIS